MEPLTHEIITEGEDRILRIEADSLPYLPTIEDNPLLFSQLFDIILESSHITKIIFHQKRDFEYDQNSTAIFLELIDAYTEITKGGLISLKHFIGDGCIKYGNYWYSFLSNTFLHKFKSDPIGSYVELHRFYRLEKEKSFRNDETSFCFNKLDKVLTYILKRLESTQLIKSSQPYLSSYHVGSRDLYRTFFVPIIKPDFMFTKLMAKYPLDGEQIASYTLNDTEVTIFKFSDNVEYLYHILPPEFKLNEEEYEVLDLARNIMAQHSPKKEEFVDPERMREVFFRIGKDLIEEINAYKNYDFSQTKMKELSHILVRYTVGFGLIEVILSDEKIQDISINSPAGNIPMFIVHGDYGDCYTNVIPTPKETSSWASKLRLISGRPLDEANQILDTELVLPNATARISAITEPLSPVGLAFSFRRHRDRPWTLPLFINYKMLTPLAAGLISFLIDGTKTILVCGTRSSGKSSLLGSLLVEIMRRSRIITIEDVLELPTKSLRKFGYNIQQMKVASALSKEGTTEMDASQGIRSTLRLGDSAIIVGEVRSKEAVALYEAMRIGAAANVVAGTIHADSPYGVFDRVVNDIGVPATSFKATDIIIVANPIRSADGLHRYKRVVSITEVRKFWDKDPYNENGFLELMKYNVDTDQLEPTDELINGESEILKSIAGNIKELAGSWDAVWENIELRGKIKQRIFEMYEKHKNSEILEAEWVIRANDRYHNIIDEVRTSLGYLNSEEIYLRWDQWFQRELKKRGYS